MSDVETNPGPRPIDQNTVFCSICSNKINRGIHQDIAHTCSDENCNARCHQACNCLSTNQIRHAKTCGRSVTWKCPQHGIGIAEIIIPSPPVYEPLSRPSPSRKSCSVSKNPIRTRYPDLACHCTNPSCDNVCHLVATYSGFVNPKRTTRTCILSTQIWHCHLHSLPSASGHPSNQSDTSPSRPTPPSLKSLLNQGLSLADAKSSKEKCAKCFAVLSSNTVTVRCSVSTKGFHQKRSTGPKASTCYNQWKCEIAPTFSRIVYLNLQLGNSLKILTHLLHNLCQLLSEISLKFTSGTLSVSVQNL